MDQCFGTGKFHLSDRRIDEVVAKRALERTSCFPRDPAWTPVGPLDPWSGGGWVRVGGSEPWSELSGRERL
jgi:hypothetical protein